MELTKEQIIDLLEDYGMKIDFEKNIVTSDNDALHENNLHIFNVVDWTYLMDINNMIRLIALHEGKVYKYEYKAEIQAKIDLLANSL